MNRPSSLLRQNNPHGQNHDRKANVRVRSWLAFTSIVLALASYATPASARTIDYCSSVNTGSDYDALVDNFQSNGLCFDKCTGYAFAIVQGSSCWCSNYIPSTESTGCDDSCPGYPDDKCGNTKKDLYGYMSLNRKPSGTKGPTSTSSTQTSTSSSTSSTSSSTKETSKTSDTTFSTSTTSRTTEAPSVTVVTTVGGFVTVIESSTPAESSSKPQATAEEANTEGDFFSDTRRAAGLIVGIILALLLIAAAVLFWRYRQNKKRALLYDSQSSGSGSIPVGGAGVFGRRRSRSLSTLGLVGEKGAPAMQQSPTTSQTGGTPNAATGAQSGEIFDQRLDPGQLFMRFDHRTGSSRMSVRSLRDDTDYSRRVLRLANPDE